MYFWKTKELANQIKAGKISEEISKNYFIAYSVLIWIFSFPPENSGIISRIPLIAGYILVAIITIVGINITFKTNKGNDGNNYIQRVIMLGLPIIIKLLIISFITAFIVNVIGLSIGFIHQGTMDINPWVVCFVLVLWQLIFYWRLNIHLNYINT